MKLFWIKEKKFSAWSNQSSIHVQPILEVQRNLILATNFDLLILMSLQPKVLDLSLKLWILIHQISLKYTRVKPSGWKDENIWVCGKEWIHLTWFVYLILLLTLKVTLIKERYLKWIFLTFIWKTKDLKYLHKTG